MKILTTIAALLLLSAATHADTQTVYATVTWVAPELHEDWEPWMGGQTIQVRVQAFTANGSNTFYGYATVDYESCNVSCVIDVTGLQGNYNYGLHAAIPRQIIHSGTKTAIVEAGPKLQFFQSPVFTPTVLLGAMKLNGSY